MIKLRFELSFFLPIVSDTFISFWPDFASFKYRFIHANHQSSLLGFPEEKKNTIIVEYFPEMNWQENLSDPRPAFANCMIFLNNFIDAYRLANGIDYRRNFSISDLPSFMITNVVDK